MKSKIFTFVLLLATFFVACEKDGDLIKVSNLESNDLVASQSTVVLEEDKATEVALTLTWSKKALIISDTSMAIPASIPSMILEISATESFAAITEATSSNFTVSYTSLELNTIAKNLGLEAFKSSPLFFRIKARLGNNTPPVYSNIVSVDVTSYSIDMSVGFILDKDKAETGVTLYSVNSDGEYKGFMGATAWYNFFLLEGDGTTWGNYGVDGYAFTMDNNASATPMWNFWFPGLNGCYYTTLSTSTKKWSANYISSLSISGDVTAVMNFTRPDVTWMASFTTTIANATFTVSGISALYNSTTGTDDASAIPGTVTFAPGNGNEVLFNQTGSFTVPGAAGDYTIKINLSNPKAWTYEITAGSVVVVEPISDYLYLPGIDDGISGKWTFDNYLNLLSEEDSTFAGVVNVNSQWGYQMGLEKDNWTDVYKMASGDANAGTLSFKDGANIPAPDAGLYLIQADLKNKAYSLTAVEKAYVTGLNDDWNLAEMTAAETVGVYTAEITITKASSWGFQVFIDDQWKNKFGGSKGILSYNGANITDDATLAPGTYTLIVNFVKGTYTIVGKQIYVAGLNDKWDFSSAVLSKTATGVYSGQVTISTATPWGYYFLLYPDNWDAKFGGSESALTFGGANIVADWYATMGTYTMSVDFIGGKCTIN